VGRLTKNVTSVHLEEIFDVYGKIVDIELPKDKRRQSLSLLHSLFVRALG
jgi:hypothetical protein